VSDEEMGKTIIMCNHDDANSIMAALVMGAAAAATGELVLMFFQPGAAKALVKGELEKFQGKKGLPDPVELFNTILDEGGRIILCELALENKGIKAEDLRDERIEILAAPPFLMDVQDARLTFNF
jgi:predicted peroxiredoxin